MIAADPAMAAEARPPGAPTRARVLIVDDDERNLLAAVEALSALGHELVTARSGHEALRRLLDEEEYAVILLDLHMPGMDGYETAQLIRSRKRTRDVPIVFVTAVFRDEAHIFQAYAAGAVDVVFKPADPFVLRAKVAVLADLHLKTVALRLEAEHRQRLLDENARVQAEKQDAERKLRQSQEQQEAILRSLPIVFHSRKTEPPFAPSFVSDSVLEVTGFTPERFIEEPGFGMSRIHPDDRASVAAAHAEALETGLYRCEYRWQAADGSWRSLLDQGVLAPEAEDGPRAIIGTLLDNTDRRLLEQQLGQARQMEAVGQLTGGVAHDFNNLLTVVLGNVDLLDKPANSPRQTRQLGAIRHAADRGRSLTRQLLAFSRRQHLVPVVLDVNGLIATFAPLIRQAVGEAVDVTLDLAPGELNTHVDAAQLESALLNLAVNARDAMPRGGEITIATRALDADWIDIEVRDQGEGMAPDILDRVFEPFFTTKEVGKGSGLGLSQVHGFVNQSGGRVLAHSEPGAGTRFNLQLARTAVSAAPRSMAAPPAEIGGGDRILVVEDDPAVLSLAVDMLDSLGYQVQTATDASGALEVLRKDRSIDLVFSDVVMPGGVSGVQLGLQAVELRPDLKVLLTSGYVGDSTRIPKNGFDLIDKPYERSVLAAKLRELLDAKVAPGPLALAG
jgi:signal transduction histidine kinase